MIVSIDSGSSYMKAIYKDQVHWEPAITTELPANANIKEKIQIGNDEWFVCGSRGLEQSIARLEEPDNRDDFHGSERQMKQITYALAQMGVEGKQRALMISLPYDALAKKEVTQELKERKIYQWYDRQNVPKMTTFENVFIVPQGVGAYNAYKTEKNLDASKYKKLLIVDIGACTTDFLYLKWNDNEKRFNEVVNLSKSIKSLSTGIFIRELKNEIYKDTPEEFPINYHELERMVRNGEYKIKNINFKQKYLELKKYFTSQLENVIQNELGAYYNTTDLILFTGGGISFTDKFKDHEKMAIVDPMANTRGQHYMGESMIKGK